MTRAAVKPPVQRSPDPAPATRVRCRQIADADLDALAGLLAEGFAHTGMDYWRRGFARAALLPPVEGMPRFGYALESEKGLVGALLLFSSRRGTRIFANLSSWYVRPTHRAHAGMLVAMATKLRHVTYVNISPAPHTWQTLSAQGFKPYNFGRSAVMPLLGLRGGKVTTEIPASLPDAELLNAHRTMGCTVVMWEKKGEVLPFVFRPRRVEHPPVKVMELIYCRDTEDFRRAGPALGRYFLKSGAGGFLLDGKAPGMPGHYVDGKEPRYYRGPHAPNLNDLAFTEKVIFG